MHAHAQLLRGRGCLAWQGTVPWSQQGDKHHFGQETAEKLCSGGGNEAALHLEELDDMLGLNGQGLAARQLSQGRFDQKLAFVIHRGYHAIQVLEIPLCDQHPVALLEGGGVGGLCAHGGNQGGDLITRVGCLPRCLGNLWDQLVVRNQLVISLFCDHSDQLVTGVLRDQ